MLNFYDDLKERLTWAEDVLNDLANKADDDYEKFRLLGKSAGVRLALSYLEEYK